MTKLSKLPERHLLYEPRFLEVFEKYKPGEPLDCSKLHLSRISWPPEAVGEIHKFIQKGYLNILVQLLEKHPIAIAHPIVFWQIWHLSKLLKRRDKEQVEKEVYLYGIYPEEGETILTREEKQVVKETLQELLQAWVSRMLPGFQVVKRLGKLKAGRKPNLSDVREEELFLIYEEIKCTMEVEISPSAFKRKINESDTAFSRRAKAVVAQIGSEYGDELPPKTVNAIVKYATQKTTKSISQPRILYGIMAYKYKFGPNPDSVRRIIERKNKAAKSRRRSRHNSPPTSRR